MFNQEHKRCPLLCNTSGPLFLFPVRSNYSSQHTLYLVSDWACSRRFEVLGRFVSPYCLRPQNKPWRWRQHVSLTPWCIPTSLYSLKPIHYSRENHVIHISCCSLCFLSVSSIAVSRELRFLKEISKANWILYPSHTVIIRYNEAVKCNILLTVWLSKTEAERRGRSRHPTKTVTPPPFRERAVTITNSLSGLARADLLTPALYAETQHAELD